MTFGQCTEIHSRFGAAVFFFYYCVIRAHLTAYSFLFILFILQLIFRKTRAGFWVLANWPTILDSCVFFQDICTFVILSPGPTGSLIVPLDIEWDQKEYIVLHIMLEFMDSNHSPVTFIIYIHLQRTDIRMESR